MSDARVPDRPLKKAGGFKWRKWNNILHRDIGYLAAALTIVYAISGVAVNHIHQWNPNYTFEHEVSTFPPLPAGASKAQIVAHLRESLDLPEPKETFKPAPMKIQLFYEGWNVEADLEAGRAEMERPRERPILRDSNYLHLNHPKGLWTWFADLYAVALAFLAISGLFVLKGKKGLTGRGKWLFGLGLILPLVFIALRYLDR
ncbi:MAG: PepSY-associated TM helix domain-containing protein [Deltaproteobacteria bacterium]|nr:PepSY-associated TM helix domain-containing protein [Deltaproteobacteria bacterium]